MRTKITQALVERVPLSPRGLGSADRIRAGMATDGFPAPLYLKRFCARTRLPRLRRSPASLMNFTQLVVIRPNETDAVANSCACRCATLALCIPTAGGFRVVPSTGCSRTLGLQASRFIEWRERAFDLVVCDHRKPLRSGRAANIGRARQRSGRAHRQPTRSGCHFRRDPIFRCRLYGISSYGARCPHSVIDSARCYPTTVGHCSSSRCRRPRTGPRRQAGNAAKSPDRKTATWRASHLSLRLWVPPPSPATRMRSPTQ